MRWVGTWACGPQTTEQNNLPPSPGLNGNTLRQAVHVSLGGTRLRVRLSNEFGTNPVVLGSVHVADYLGSGAIDPATDRALSFAGSSSVTIPVGEFVWSDGLDYDLKPLSNLAITIHFESMSGAVTGHPGSRTTSYLAPGNTTTQASMGSAAAVAHWYFITGVDVMAAAPSGAVVILGDSIADGRGSTTDGNDRWPDRLAERLQANPSTRNVAVLNQGIGGNAVLSGGLGPTASARFERDVLGQSGVKWLIVHEGVNDIGSSGGQGVADQLISAYQSFVARARGAGIRAYGATILPFGASSYYTADHEAARQKVNAWIREPGNFDAVIDFDAAVRDPQDAARLLMSYDSGDGLHLNPNGYQKMAEAVELTLFTQ